MTTSIQLRAVSGVVPVYCTVFRENFQYISGRSADKAVTPAVEQYKTVQEAQPAKGAYTAAFVRFEGRRALSDEVYGHKQECGRKERSDGRNRDRTQGVQDELDARAAVALSQERRNDAVVDHIGRYTLRIRREDKQPLYGCVEQQHQLIILVEWNEERGRQHERYEPLLVPVHERRETAVRNEDRQHRFEEHLLLVVDVRLVEERGDADQRKQEDKYRDAVPYPEARDPVDVCVILINDVRDRGVAVIALEKEFRQHWEHHHYRHIDDDLPHLLHRQQEQRNKDHQRQRFHRHDDRHYQCEYVVLFAVVKRQRGQYDRNVDYVDLPVCDRHVQQHRRRQEKQPHIAKVTLPHRTLFRDVLYQPRCNKNHHAYDDCQVHHHDASVAIRQIPVIEEHQRRHQHGYDEYRNKVILVCKQHLRALIRKLTRVRRIHVVQNIPALKRIDHPERTFGDHE